ncbi:hypothetical protein ACIRPK_29955 [Kitasatospora sp. NPDC101801]|uniref:hypothetical protein n=1 Tax=Kitasatospora sp. NPDC101801 TaxID=3364103 RepID=UPI00382287C4
MTADNVILWESLVAAEQNIAKLRAAVNGSNMRIDILAAALSVEAPVWDQGAALNFLRLFTRDVPEFVPQLFRFAVGGKWEVEAREVLVAGPREEVASKVARHAIEYLPKPDVEDYLQLASLLAALGSGDALAMVSSDALASADSEIQGAGVYIRQRYSHMIES